MSWFLRRTRPELESGRKFYVGGKEIKWDLMVESKTVFEKDCVDDENNEDEEDVVIEFEADVKESKEK